MSETDQGETIIRVEGRAGRITLNRPKALNALSYGQVGAIARALDAWESDATVELVILDGAGDRALCAGGDVRALYHARESDPDLAARFWRDEYILNARIHRYPKPFVAIMDGIVMGGGIGLSAHASHRVVTDASQLAMPETAIGLIPDVGGTFLLSRAPGRMGEYLGLLGERMGAADALYAGFADSHVTRADLDGLLSELVDPKGEPVGVTIAEYARAPAPAQHAGRQADVDRVFSAGSVGEILARLRADDGPDWGGEAATTLEGRSPLANALTLDGIRRAREFTHLEQALVMEFRLTNRLFEGGEFLEGVRAALVDKDHAPQWQHASAAAVPAATVQSYFAPFSERADLDVAMPTT